MQKKKRQHFVWRKYLRQWADEEKIFCLMENRIIEPNLMRIAQERYFYKPKELTHDEIKFLDLFISKIDNHMLRKLNHGWIDCFTQVFELQNRISQVKPNKDIDKLLDIAITNYGEELQTKIETRGEEYLDKLYDEDTSFWHEDDGAMHFIHYLCMQYFRTQKMKNNVVKSLGVFEKYDFNSIWSVLMHVFATNVSWSVYSDRHSFSLNLLKNNTNVPFITSDQPVINTFAIGLPLSKGPEDIELYYPVSPNKAILLSPKKDRSKVGSVLLSEHSVNKFNSYIFEQSGRQVYGSVGAILEQYIH